MINAILDATLGALVTCLAAFAATRLGWIEISLRKPFAPPVSRKGSHLNCFVTVEEKSAGDTAIDAPVRLFATIANQSEVAARALRGHWKVVTPNKSVHAILPIRREVLAPGDQFLDSCLIEAAEDEEDEGIRFEAEIECEYIMLGEDEPHQERVRYRYDGTSHKMVVLAASK